MTRVEHYFENLLFDGEDVRGNYNKDSLTMPVRLAVEECAQYVLYSLFNSRKEFLAFARGGDAE